MYREVVWFTDCEDKITITYHFNFRDVFIKQLATLALLQPFVGAEEKHSITTGRNI